MVQIGLYIQFFNILSYGVYVTFQMKKKTQ